LDFAKELRHAERMDEHGYEQRIEALCQSARELIAEIHRLRECNHEMAAELTRVRRENEMLRREDRHSRV
jgi:hypothetical protein